MSFTMSDTTEIIVKKLIESGYAIDPYSDSWHSRNQDVELINDEMEHSIHLENLSIYDEEEDPAYRNHLLIFFVSPYNTELIKSLSEMYEPLRYIFEEDGGGRYWPNFIFVNLKLGKVLCVGVGRNYSLFGFDLDEYVANSELSFSEADLYDIYGNCSKYFENFRVLDISGFITHIIFNLYELAITNEDWVNYMAEHDHDEPYSDEMNECLEKLELSLAALRIYFPMIDAGDLNPDG